MMKWTLREKTQSEMESELSMFHGYGDKTATIEKNVCPYVVTLGNGEVRGVWTLTEQEIVGLIRINVKELNNGSRSDKHLDWTFKIVKSWSQKHPNQSAVLVSQLNNLKSNAKTPLARDFMDNAMGPLANKKLAEAKIIATYLNHGNAPSRDQINAVIDNQAKFEMEKSSEGQSL